MKTILNYLGPHSPWGPEAGGVLSIIVGIISAAFIVPPAIWLFWRWLDYWFK